MKFNSRFLIATLLVLAGCANNTDCYLPPEDISSIRGVSKQYVDSWLADDTSGVLGLFREDAFIYPSGMEPLRGIDKIRDFWFPDDSSKTKILKYEIEIEEVSGCLDHAYSIERGNLAFNYSKGQIQMSRESRSQAVTTYQRINGQWKIVRRIWTDLR